MKLIQDFLDKLKYKFGVAQEDGTSFWIDEQESDFRIINAQKISLELNQLFFNNEFLTIIIIFSTFIFCTTWFIWQAFYHDCLDAIFQIDRSKLI